MHYIITGGTGFLGTALVKHLLKHPENKITILSRGSNREKDGVRFLQWDGKTFPAATGPADVVINLAGSGLADRRWNDAHKKEVINSRVNSAKACVAYIQNCEPKPKVFLSGSGINFHGGDRQGPVDESSSPGNDFMAEVCKLWEKAGEGAGVRTVILRTGVIFGKEGGPLPVMVKPFRFFVGGTLGNGKQLMPWLHLTDWIRTIDFLVENERISGPVILSVPEATMQKDLAKAIGKALKRPYFWIVPGFILRLLLGEMSVMALGSLDAKPRKLEGEGFQWKFTEINSAIRDILCQVR